MSSKIITIISVVKEHGSAEFFTGVNGVATKATLKALVRRGYIVRHLGNNKWRVTE
jgi:hypothetical protein